MEIAKMTSKGQLTIPKEVRIALGLNTGDKVIFVERDGGYFLVNSSHLAIAQPNLNGISASLAVEGLDTSDAMIAYARERISGRASYEGEIARIKARYQHG